MSEAGKNGNQKKRQMAARVLFTTAEDENLRRLVQLMKPTDWGEIAKRMPGRTSRQCRERYKNYLDPGVQNTKWTPEEDLLLFKLQKDFGHNWSMMKQFIPNRSSSNIKNRWSCLTTHTKFNEYREKIKERLKNMDDRHTAMQLPVPQIAKKNIDAKIDIMIEEPVAFHSQTPAPLPPPPLPLSLIIPSQSYGNHSDFCCVKSSNSGNVAKNHLLPCVDIGLPPLKSASSATNSLLLPISNNNKSQVEIGQSQYENTDSNKVAKAPAPVISSLFSIDALLSRPVRV